MRCVSKLWFARSFRVRLMASPRGTAAALLVNVKLLGQLGERIAGVRASDGAFIACGRHQAGERLTLYCPQGLDFAAVATRRKRDFSNNKQRRILENDKSLHSLGKLRLFCWFFRFAG